jgi:hypothetical protein
MRCAKPRLAAFAKSWGEKPLRRAGIYNRAATARSATQAAIRAGMIDELGRLAFSDIGNSGITMSSTSALPLSAAPRAKQPA